MLLCVQCLEMETEVQCALPLPKESQVAILRVNAWRIVGTWKSCLRAKQC